jgi:hypothetical protein
MVRTLSLSVRPEPTFLSASTVRSSTGRLPPSLGKLPARMDPSPTSQPDAAPALAPPPVPAPGPAAPPSPLPVPALGWRSFAILAAIYLYSFPYFDQMRSANEMPRVLMTQQIVDHHTCQIDARVGEMGSTYDLSHGSDGHLYSNKAPGPSFLAVPVYAVLKRVGATSIRASTWAFRVFAVTLPSLVFLWFFYRDTTFFTDDERARRLALVAFALGSTALPYSILFMSHQLAAICVGGAFLAALAIRRGGSVWWAVLVGALLGAAVMMDYQTIFIGPLVGLYCLVRAGDWRRRLAVIPLMLLGVAPFALALGAYHAVHFGSPLTTPLGSSNEKAVKKGFMGLIGPNKEAFWVLLLAPANGMLVLMPWVVFALVGAVAILVRREERRRAGVEAVTCLLIVAVYTVVLGSLVPSYAKAGWTVGPRYLGACFPFMAWLAAAGFGVAQRRLATRVLAQGAVLVSAIIFVAAVSTFPQWPEDLKNPLFELVFRLAYHGYAPWSLGTVLGLRGLLALLPLYLGGLAFIFWMFSRGQRQALAGALLAVVVAGGLLGAYRTFPLTGAYANRAWSYITSIWEPRRG